MPLLWSHAEFLKLCIAAGTRRPVEQLDSVRVHLAMPATGGCWHWRQETPVADLPARHALAITRPTQFALHFGWDGWNDVTTRDARVDVWGLWSVRFDVVELAVHRTLEFTTRFGDVWEGGDHRVRLHSDAAPALIHTP
jgi:glucoamylase